AIQVADSFKKYAKKFNNISILPIYGGQNYQSQLKALKKGAQVIVGTPGRLIDHFNRGTIHTNVLKTVVLDEADEMLNMGFIKDIKWILNQISNKHQTALFSATMPDMIKKISKTFLKNPKKIQIKPEENVANNIEQYFIKLSNKQKLETLSNILAVEDIKAAIIFARTKNSTSVIAKKLQTIGYSVGSINGDIKQFMRKKIVDQLKNRDLDIIVATDLVSRGIDVAHISHVINFDMPFDKESYTHRIGRTGRAGRKGKAISFVTSKEGRLFNSIKSEKYNSISPFKLPSSKKIADRKLGVISQKISDAIKNRNNLKHCYKIIASIAKNNKCSTEDVAAAIIYLEHQDSLDTIYNKG
ncbi:MAG: DEAD/DEAH box helicase, partial [Legionellales bacterium]|nr:DEAD/DEAH box helicase [Legionellales bacterium]